MTPRERGFLLLTCPMGDPARRVLTVAQLRNLARRVCDAERKQEDRELNAADLRALGYGEEMSQRILMLLDEDDRLEHYLAKARRAGCIPITRVTEGYPLAVRKKLGLDSPGSLWARGDLSVLAQPKIALVGSRELKTANWEFASEAGLHAARQGFALVSGNARGADRTAQETCLAAGGKVISVVADELETKVLRPGILYLSEDGFDLPFSSVRALSRNRVIHALGEAVLLAQCTLAKGGTWHGAVNNLRFGWSPVYGFRDGSEAMTRLYEMGACPVEVEDLRDLTALTAEPVSLFDKGE